MGGGMHEDDAFNINRGEDNSMVGRLRKHLGVISFVTNVLLLIIFYGWLAYGMFMELYPAQDFMQPLMLMMPISMLLFCFVHSMAALGWRLSLVFLVIALMGTYLFEALGVATGVVFGAYKYTEIEGLHILGVPLEVPFSWFMMLYLSFCVADLIIGGQAHHRRPKHRYLNLITLSISTGFIMTGWDLSADPLASTRSSVWVWEHDNGFYFGVPLLNFAGWFITSTLLIGLYLVCEYYIHGKALHPLSVPSAALPLVAFFGMMWFYVIMSQPVELCLIAAFTMGFPLLLAVTRLIHSHMRTQQVRFDASYRDIEYSRPVGE